MAYLTLYNPPLLLK